MTRFTRSAGGRIGSASATRDVAYDVVATGESTASASYVALTTAGPAVSVTVGASGMALVHFGMVIHNTAAYSFASVAVSGASTVAASDDWVLQNQLGAQAMLSRSYLFTGLTPGVNTFTVQYRVSGGTGTFQRRHIVADAV